MALKARRGTWAYGRDAHTPVDAARAVAWDGPDAPGEWTAVTRTFRDGHTQTWWAADAVLGAWGPDSPTRLVVATADPATLPDKATWYLATDLPRPGGPRQGDNPHEPAGLAELVRIYGIRHWIEQGYKQVKDELGWADFQVRSDIAIRRHQTLVTCAFSFCWDTWFTDPPSQRPTASSEPAGQQARRERGRRTPRPARTALLAEGDPRRPRLADPLDRVATLVAGMVQRAPARRTSGPDQRGRHGAPAGPLPPALTNHR